MRSIDMGQKCEYTYTYEDDKIVRASEYTITVGGNEIITGKTLVNTIAYTYDADGKLTKKQIKPASGSEQVYYYENPENENPVVKFTAGGRTVTSHSKNDNFGRKVFDELQLGKGFISRQFHYHAGKATTEHTTHDKLKSSPTTQLVSEIVLSDGRTLQYEYDAEERITKVTDSVDGVTQYTYDALGQLLTETVNGTVVNTMTYDNYGNIRTKGSNTYTYGDSVWKDRLTAYNGQTITYDKQGNPTSYLGHTLTWEKGRQLKSFGNNSYTYNANGIRTSKTINGVKHTYLLDGTKILRETWGSNTLIPLYDNEDSVCGILHNSTPYYFLKNLQGDIIAITNKYGTVVARYAYDAWGKVLKVTNASGTVQTSSSFIGNVNPFRYRSYYYDTEIGLYYLQSRYYDPTLGRFVNADEMECLGPGENVIEYNLYIYCKNAPTINIDPSGYLSLDMKVLGKKYWLAKFISLFTKTLSKPKKLMGINLWWLGIKLSMSATCGYSAKGKPSSFFKVSKNKLDCKVGGISFSVKSSKISLSISTTLFSTSLKSFVSLTKSEVIFGFSLTQTFKQNKKNAYISVEFAVSIKYLTLAVVAVAIAGACAFVPAFVPVASKIATGMAKLIANARGTLTSVSSLIATGFRTAAAIA